ncbi:MAG TPA: alanine racemase [Candidatus Sumerlaeota bacterium]|nr:alanine racemase [Candidatus Sumerlaeota bacterium]
MNSDVCRSSESFAVAGANQVARISLRAFRENIQVVRKRLAPGVGFAALVKSDGYGHGAARIARAAVEEGCRFLIVASLDDALELRAAGVEGDVLIVGPIFPEQAPEVVAGGFAVAGASLEILHSLETAATRLERRARVHLKFDTGMGRLGFLDDTRELPRILEKICCFEHLEFEGAMTHFCESDAPDPQFTQEQARRFRLVLRELEAVGMRPRWIHAANSDAALRHPDLGFSMVRTGIALYGVSSSGLAPGAESTQPELDPVMTALTRIADLRQVPANHPISYGRTHVTRRPSRLAVIPVGYGDGYPRSASNRAQVLIQGQRAPVLGRITMNLTVVDVTDIGDVSLGAPVLLFGRQGGHLLRVEELAHAAGAIPYEILCNMGCRLPRVYLEG